MKLGDLFEGFTEIDPKQPDSTSTNLEITGISTNTSTLKPGDIFVAIKGATTDRHQFIDEAIKKGAVAICYSDLDYQANKISNSKGDSPQIPDIPFILVPDTNAALIKICQNFYHNPQKKLRLFGITGTDGKTTTAIILQNLLGEKETAYIGTNGAQFGEFYEDIANTTPDPETLYRLLNKFQELGAKNVVMELSSEAQHYHRLDFLEFDFIGLTNITSEHLNTHKTLANYYQAKLDIITKHLKKNGYFVTNGNLDNFEQIVSDVEKNRPDIQIKKFITQYEDSAEKLNQDLIIKDYDTSLQGSNISYLLPDLKPDQESSKNQDVEFNIHISLIGYYNIENFSLAFLIDFYANPEEFSDLYTLPPNMPPVEQNYLIKVPGRMEIFKKENKPTVIIDYAHTPNGLKNLFDTVKQIHPFQKIITVSGQAGSRDNSKRPKVGATIAKNSDLFIITSEDPHFEDYQNVVADIESGIIALGVDKSNQYQVILSRYQAIKEAIDYASPDDLVLVLGKGAETTHNQNNENILFSDILAVEDILENKERQYFEDFEA